ncbi:penicillin-binding transpeptidase domain-containing protein [Bordetella sp. FB-8]|uniref:penicillin-binding transpeptidase domain-containing protein n=1 Tax=Bordetella sp. FB-8 TaxID=1159870 RepID=UPI0003A75325|nr:penicillin-binding transpeptidase domain-containing protein [Bordetella sp. FB-8]
MPVRAFFPVIAAILIGFAHQTQARTVCTIAADAATGRTLLEQGDCAMRETPAATAKIALAVMSYDAGLLKNQHDPVQPFKQGYVDWGGAPWRHPTEPVRWLKYSVVWYSQQITHALGPKTLHDYAVKFGYGKADFSGDPGKHNGLDRAWIASSRTISPQEQIAFLSRRVNRRPPVSAHAMDMTLDIVEKHTIQDGWFRTTGKCPVPAAAAPATPCMLNCPRFCAACDACDAYPLLHETKS